MIWKNIDIVTVAAVLLGVAIYSHVRNVVVVHRQVQWHGPVMMAPLPALPSMPRLPRIAYE